MVTEPDADLERSLSIGSSSLRYARGGSTYRSAMRV
jgi:hypothetical protein